VSEPAAFSVPLFNDPLWQMAYGERSALEGLLSQLKPALAIETGTAQGGSLRRIATHSQEVHAFDIVPEVKALEQSIPNATVHIGDSRVTLPEVLAGFAAEGRQVDFAFVDGDHTREGVKRDLAAILASDACRKTVVTMHDTANDEVRAGIEELDLPHHPRVAMCVLDFVPGYLVVRDHEVYSHAAWNGLGLLVLDADRTPGQQPIGQWDRYSSAEVIQRARASYEAQPDA
jgi:hypothetical protein